MVVADLDEELRGRRRVRVGEDQRADAADALLALLCAARRAPLWSLSIKTHDHNAYTDYT